MKPNRLLFDKAELARRSLPLETVEGLGLPQAGFPYLQHADRFPIECRRQDYSPVNAWWLADASFLVYGDGEFVESHFAASPLPSLGYQIDWLGTSEKNRGIVLKSSEAVVIVFRGTRIQRTSLPDVADLFVFNQDDLIVDSQFSRKACRAGGKVHRGFLEAYAEVAKLVADVAGSLSSRQTLWLTGHSLGGALATVAAAHLDNDLIKGLYTFGAPRVGNGPFVNCLPKRAWHRFVHGSDWVPAVPPAFLGYLHAGKLHRISSTNSSRVSDSWRRSASETVDAMKAMARKRSVDMGQLPVTIGGLADHAPIFYATRLWNVLLESSDEG